MKNQTSPKEICQRIYFIRNCRVMLDSDLARLYKVETGNLNKAVRRNKKRFPTDFMFQITTEEYENLKFQSGTSSLEQAEGWGGRRKLPLVFTEQGVAMLSSVLHSERAVLVNIEIMRTFAQLKEYLLSNKELALKLSALERKYDGQFKIVFDAIKQLMIPPQIGRQRKIGISQDEN